MLAAVIHQLVEVVLRDDLHEAFGASHALGDGVVTRFDRHDREDEEGVDRMLLAGAVRGGNITRDGAFGDAVALGNELGHRTLLALDRRLGARLDRACNLG